MHTRLHGAIVERTSRRVRDGFEPPLVEVVEQPLFDFGSDVGVRLLDLVVHDVAEAPRLSDFGYSVGDHPGFVAVSESVKGETGLDSFSAITRRVLPLGDIRLLTCGDRAVGGGAERSSGEVAAGGASARRVW
jgi:hypothetical protein